MEKFIENVKGFKTLEQMGPWVFTIKQKQDSKSKNKDSQLLKERKKGR